MNHFKNMINKQEDLIFFQFNKIIKISSMMSQTLVD